MEWKELKIYTNHFGVEPLSNALIANGIQGFVINDPEDIKEFERNKNASWDYIGEEVYELCGSDTYLTVYVAEDDIDGAAAVRASVEMIRGQGDFGSLEIKCGSIKEEDWANNWKQYFKPLDIGKRLTIKPSWEDVPDDSGRVILEIDPETSFGTGRHHTTRLCLELLEDNVSQEDTVCDLGCGSGIISIAAMLYGAKSAVAVDISQDAMKISKNNALKNGIPDDKYTSYCGDVITDPAMREKIGKGYSLVTANIVADVLIAMSDVFMDITKPGGTLILSGIITDRVDEVFECVKSKGFTLIEARECEMWNAAVFKKA